MNFTESRRIPRWKRILDLTCIVLSAPLWLPLMVLIAVWVKLVSRGPVFYKQERIGYRGFPFLCLKFRSMKLDAETFTHEQYFQRLIASDTPMTKLDEKGDSRLIPGGKLLRAIGMDELPQLFNVLRGEMSIVGPRPCTTSEFQHYQPHHRRRVNAPPGLTGLWQVSGKNRTTFSEMIEMDVSYSQNMSVLVDLWIMARTVPALIVQAVESRSTRTNGRRELPVPKAVTPSEARVAAELQRAR